MNVKFVGEKTPDLVKAAEAFQVLAELGVVLGTDHGSRDGACGYFEDVALAGIGEISAFYSKPEFEDEAPELTITYTPADEGERNKAATALASRRWAGKTAEERSQHGKKMAEARWGKRSI